MTVLMSADDVVMMYRNIKRNEAMRSDEPNIVLIMVLKRCWSSKSWIDTWCAGYSVQHWGLSGGVMSDTGTPQYNLLKSE